VAIDKLADAGKHAALDTAVFITRDLKASATQHGWDKESVSKTRVTYTPKGYALSVEPEAEQNVMRLEYGTERVAPTAVIRKYSNNTAAAERFFIKSLESHLGAKL
jgi:hypothetical protein